MLVNSFAGFEVVVDALNGKELMDKLSAKSYQPDIVLIDVNMPVMDGAQTAENITRSYPLVKTVALSMKEDDLTIINMIRAGCCAYLLKDVSAGELEIALKEVDKNGYYNADASNINFRRLVRMALGKTDGSTLTEKEKQFIQLAASDLTYKQIASRMNMAERTIDGYRESLFEKLNVQSRVGMVLEGVRRGLVSL